MTLYLTALNPTEAVTHGFLPAAARLDVDVVILTDQPDRHLEAYRGSSSSPTVLETQVRDAGAVAARVAAGAARYGKPTALLSNSDHLQTATALAAELLGLPAKPWQAAQRCKNKFLTRRTLTDAGLDFVASVDVGPGDDVAEVTRSIPLPAVVKPREGVASEDVFLVGDSAELVARAGEVRARHPGTTVLVEEFLTGTLRTYDTLGDATALHHFGSWRTTLAEPPQFTELRLDWDPLPLGPAEAHLRAQLDALGVGFGACHTEFVVQGDRARLIEVNYRLIGDTMDMITSELLDVDLFAEVIRLHRGEPLRADLPGPAGPAWHGRVDYITADRAGTLAAAPAESHVALASGVQLGHRRLREVGVTAGVYGTNRDYLSVIHAIGPDSGRVDAAVDEFRAGHQWVVA